MLLIGCALHRLFFSFLYIYIYIFSVYICTTFILNRPNWGLGRSLVIKLKREGEGSPGTQWLKAKLCLNYCIFCAFMNCSNVLAKTLKLFVIH